MLKKFVCLAKSAREGGFCIAGKEILANGGIGNWFRPIGSSEEALPIADCTFNIGNVVACEVSNHAPSPTQPENYKVALRPNWQVHGVFPKQNINLLVDSPLSLWSTGFNCSSRHGMNDRVSLNTLYRVNNSLYFIRIAGGTVIKKDQSDEERQNTKIRLAFSYKNKDYSLVVTDPAFTDYYWNTLKLGESTEKGSCYLTISLGKQFNNYCYKLDAGHVSI